MRLLTIQYLRGLAASLIVLHHAFAHPLLTGLYPVAFAQVGVDVFFVISGVIMWVTTESKTFATPWTFWRARLVRIAPLYWLATIAFIAAAAIIPSQVFHTEMTPWFVLSSFLFIPATSPAGLTVPVYSLGWTLNYEMFFYLVFGLCLRVQTPARRLIAVSCAILGLVTVGQVVKPQGVIAATYSDPIMLEFLSGVLAGAAFRQARRLRVPLIAGIGVVIASVVLFVGLLPFGVPRPVAFGLPALLCVCGALLAEMSGPRRNLPVGRWLGDASYSIYLAHPFVLRPFFIASSMAIASPAWTTQIALVAIATVVGLVGGLGCYALIERSVTAFTSRLLLPPRQTNGEGG